MPALTYLHLREPTYPASARCSLGDRAPARITAIGSLAILERQTTALFCSVKCPGNLILQTYDLARAMRDAGATVIGGFHSPMEKECLAVLLRGTQPIIICPARSLAARRLPVAWRAPIARGRLLLLSPFDEKDRRATADLAQRRNELVAALADEIVIAHAAADSRLAAFARDLLDWGKPLFTLAGADNDLLIRLGAQPLSPTAWATR